MNSLNINLKKGQKVIMEGNAPIEARTVEIIGGFGMNSFTAGTALFVKLVNGNEARMNSMEIEKLAEN